MENQQLINKFGFSEMYEWKQIPPTPLGIFVTFDNERPDRIVPYGEVKDAEVLGVTTVNSTIDSDDPAQWKFAYMCNEVGDMYLRKERLAVGGEVYDQVLELNFIQTRPWEHYIPIENEAYKKDLKYVPRTNRAEWIRVNLMGKVIVRDDGHCVPGQYCQPYAGRLKEFFGSAVPAQDYSDQKKYYVLARLSEKTILILNK